MDRGFELMVPKNKEEDKKTKFNYGIRFTLFGSEYVIQFKVNRKE